MLDKEIEHYFDESDIPRTFDLLEKHFSISKEWRSKYSQKKMSSKHRYELEVFVMFLKENIEPSLQKLTMRRDPIVISLLKYVVRMKINKQRG